MMRWLTAIVLAVVLVLPITATALVYTLDYVYIVETPIKYYREYGAMKILGTVLASENTLRFNFTFIGDTWAKLNWSVPLIFNGISFNGSMRFNNGTAIGSFEIITNNTYSNTSMIMRVIIRKAEFTVVNGSVEAKLLVFVKYNNNQGFIPPAPMDVTVMVRRAVEDLNLTWIDIRRVTITPVDAYTMRVDADLVMHTGRDSNPLVTVTYCMLANRLSGEIRLGGETGFASTNRSVSIVADGSLGGNITRFAECLDEKFIENYFLYNKVMPRYPFRVNVNITTLFNGNHSVTTTNITIENVETTSPEDVGKRIMILLESLGGVMDPYDIRYLPRTVNDTVKDAYISVLYSGAEPRGANTTTSSASAGEANTSTVAPVTVTTRPPPQPSEAGGTGTSTAPGGHAYTLAAATAVSAVAAALVLRKRLGKNNRGR